MRNAVLASCAALLLVVGCSAAPTNNLFNGGGVGGDTGSSSSSSSGVGGFIGGGGAGGSGNTSSSGGCSMAATLVYVLSEANVLYSFQPQQKQFKKIGPLLCATSMLPNSMAVDRNANAYVNYVQSDPTNGDDTAGSVFKVNTADASCQPTSIQLGSGWYRLGMGFSSDTSGGTSETLFVAGTGGALGGTSPGLAKINLGTGALAPIGQFDGALNGQNAELTGTGDARLFGFFTTTPVQVAEIDKGSAMIKSQKALAQVETPFAWAFSFWGGDFYLYTAPDKNLYPSRTTNVTKYHPQDGSADPQYMVDIGFRIVGAGVSTCAPIAPPK